ncbi:MAG TPA: FkbM family methyltransferase [Phycisphaerales bacterium]|nr:FkbM family methyltransferase [Phycisphaerales bacterium]
MFPVNSSPDETHVPHVGWLAHEGGDDVGRYVREGWFEFAEQAFWWLYLRPGDSVIDCGAHVGLFTLLASQAVGEYGRVIALEPNPATAALLRKNADAIGARNIEVIEAAAASRPGSLTLHAGAGKTSAYSSSVAGVAGASDIKVKAVTIDDLVRDRHVESIAMLKLDVEGAELDAWKGCSQTVKANRIALAMVEFTEANQRAAGASSDALVEAWSSSGFQFHRFNAQARQIEPADVLEPIEYENLFALRDANPINRRLREASPQRQRIARDVLKRGEAAHALLKRGCDVEHYQQLLAELQQRLEESLKRGSDLAHQLSDTRERLHTYAAYIDRVLNSRTGRVARALHLANTPGWIDMLRKDLAGFEAAINK